MPFKLAKTYLSIFIERSCTLGILAFALSMIGEQSHATLKVRTRFGGKTDEAKKIAYLAVSYDGGKTTPLTNWLIDDEDIEAKVDFSVIDLDQTQASDPKRVQAILFDLESDKKDFKAENGQNLVITVYTVGSSAEKKYLPIASFNDNADDPNLQNVCTDSRCQGVQSVDNQDFYRAVKYIAGNKIQIGMYISDICRVYSVGGGSATGCNATAGQLPIVELNKALLKLNFAINTAPTNSRTELSTSFDGQEVGSLTLNFQTVGPLFSNCPTTDQAFYFPGDKKVYVNTTGFKISSASGTAPLDSLIAVGNKDDGPPDITQNFAKGNQVVSRPGLGPSQAVGPLENSSDSEPISYQFGFMIRDYTGLIAPGSSTSTAAPFEFTECTLKGIQSSEIQGFLKKSNCFIATAAFGDRNAWPVRILREFRNQILNRYSKGKDLTRWYYSWSPRASHWLELHPAMKSVVATLLIPITLMAWLILNPVFAAVCFGVAATSLFLIRRDPE